MVCLNLRAAPAVHPPQLSAVADVALTAAGDVLVADGDGGANNRLLLLRGTNLSDVLWSVGGAGAGPGLFSSPHSVAYEPGADRALVADRGNARIQFLAAADGRVLGQWALAADCGLPAGALPWGLRVDAPRERLLVVDGATGHFYALALPAQRPGAAPGPCVVLQATAVAPTASNPHELGVDAATGDVYVALVGAPTGVLRYVRKG